MSRISIYSLFLLTAVSTSVTALEIEVGFFDLAPCSKVEWRNDGPLGLASPTVGYGPQRVIVRAIVDGPNVSQEPQLQQVRQCSQQASANVGIALMAANPPESNQLFKAALLQCLKVSGSNAQISVVALKTESRCEW